MVKKILIIGNGFDLAHGLPTSYSDFLEFCRAFMGLFDSNSINLASYKDQYLDKWQDGQPEDPKNPGKTLAGKPTGLRNDNIIRIKGMLADCYGNRVTKKDEHGKPLRDGSDNKYGLNEGVDKNLW